jgi:hypothetical protein
MIERQPDAGKVNGQQPPPDDGPRTYEDVVRLARARNVAVVGLLALTQGNDPFYAGRPERRVWAQWFAGLWQEYKFPPGVHLRRVHYVLVSQDSPPPCPSDSSKTSGMAYQNTKECWQKLGRAGRDARHLGLVDAHAFEDHRNPEPELLASATESNRETGWEVDPCPEWLAPSIRMLGGDLDGYGMPDMPSVTVTGYDYEGGDQPYHVELWVEKTTMNDVLGPVCRELGVNLVTGQGFQTVTGAVKMLQRLARLPEGKPARILYVSDFDPAGERMPAAVARVVEFYIAKYAPGRDVKLTPVCLTAEQVREYQLPRIPIKEEDLRRRGFEDRHGEGAVELDALEALHPGELARTVREAVAPYHDPTLGTRLAEAREEAQEQAQAAWDEATAHRRRGLAVLVRKIGRVMDAHRGQVERLQDRMQAALAPLLAKAERARHAIDAVSVTPDLPDRPEPETDEVDEDGWLYASDRDYLEQLGHYPPQTPRKATSKPVVRKVCGGCGVEFTPKWQTARYCSDKCRVKAHRAAKGVVDGK